MNGNKTEMKWKLNGIYECMKSMVDHIVIAISKSGIEKCIKYIKRPKVKLVVILECMFKEEMNKQNK